MESISERSNRTNLTNLSLPTFIQIAKFLDVSSILSLSKTSKDTQQQIKSADFWKYYHFSIGFKLQNLKPPTAKVFEFSKELHRCLEEEDSKNITMIGLEASSTDFDQSIKDVLSDNPRSFWSSLGSDTTDAEEYLLFAFKDLVLVKSIIIDFFNAGSIYHPLPYYLSDQIIVSFGLSSDQWVYESKPFAVNNRNSLSLDMALPVNVARYMKITFKGKMGLQYTDNKYYVAVGRIKALGYPIESDNTSGYHTNALLLQALCNFYHVSLTDEDLKQIKLPHYYIQKLKNSQGFGNDTTRQLEEFEELLKTSKNNDEKWEFMEKHKDLINEFDTFDLIYRCDKNFAKDYFKFVKECKKRIYLNLQETFLVCLMSVNVEALLNRPAERRAQTVNQSEVREIINFDILQLFTYMDLDEDALGRVWDKIAPEKQEAKQKFLETCSMLWSNSHGLYNHHLIVVLISMINAINKST